MVMIRQEMKHESGIPLGGIGTGSVEVRPDGLFHEWQIFNIGQWSPESPLKNGQWMGTDDLIFVARIETPDGDVCMRYLALDSSLHDLYSYSWLKCVEAIEYDGRFPAARLRYLDRQFPLEITAEAFSPFVPGDSRLSGTPGFYVRFSIRNTSDMRCRAAILGTLRNVCGLDQESRRPVSWFEETPTGALVGLGIKEEKENWPTSGSMGISVDGGDVSYISGSYHLERPGLVYYYGSRYGMKTYSWLEHFRDEGRLPNLSPGEEPYLPEGFDASTLSAAECREYLSNLLSHSVFYSQFQKLKKPLPDIDTDQELRVELLNDMARNLKDIQARKGRWGEASLCSEHMLNPGEDAEAVFTISWFFPNHIGAGGKRLGHMYENWFEDAYGVTRYLRKQWPDIRSRSVALPDAIVGSSLPAEASEAVLAQISTLIKATWWTANGNFGVWEGLGCCGFHTTDITYQGSFPIIALFPDLQKTQMLLGARFQREDGRVHHLFQPDFDAVDDDYARVDMNQQFVMLAARDYQWTGDLEYLQRLWPHITKAMDSTAELDTDGDGLPDTDTRRNTYDVWDFQGCPSYIASLWLGALRAAALLAEAVGDDERRKQWEDTLSRGSQSFENILWNGSYYSLWTNPATGETDDCCMSDMMSGDWFAGMMGWEHMLEPDRIRTALTSILQHNFRPDWGLLNASYPEGVPQRVATSGNYQQEATWSGIEYTVAALLMEQGMVDDGMEIVRDIHNRYIQAGRFWNHVECGNHYYRAMSSWTLLLALSGFTWNAQGGELGLLPRVQNLPYSCPFFAPGFHGTHARQRGRDEITLGSGALKLASLHLLNSGGTQALVELNGEPVRCSVASEDGKLVLRWKDPLEMQAGDVLDIRHSAS